MFGLVSNLKKIMEDNTAQNLGFQFKIPFNKNIKTDYWFTKVQARRLDQLQYRAASTIRPRRTKNSHYEISFHGLNHIIISKSKDIYPCFFCFINQSFSCFKLKHSMYICRFQIKIHKNDYSQRYFSAVWWNYFIR